MTKRGFAGRKLPSAGASGTAGRRSSAFARSISSDRDEEPQRQRSSSTISDVWRIVKPSHLSVIPDTPALREILTAPQLRVFVLAELHRATTDRTGLVVERCFLGLWCLAWLNPRRS